MNKEALITYLLILLYPKHLNNKKIKIEFANGEKSNMEIHIIRLFNVYSQKCLKKACKKDEMFKILF